MAFREVRIPEARNRLVFRFDPETDTIEILVRGERHFVALAEYRPLQRRGDRGTMGVDFERIEGERGRG